MPCITSKAYRDNFIIKEGGGVDKIGFIPWRVRLRVREKSPFVGVEAEEHLEGSWRGTQATPRGDRVYYKIVAIIMIF